MKKILALLLLFLVFMPLFALVTIPEEVPQEYAVIMRKALEDNLKGRGDDAGVKAFSLEEGIVSFTLQVEGKEFSSTVPADRVAEEIRNMLFYEPSLYDEGEILDYVYNNSFSFLPKGTYGKGDVVKALDKDGKLRGRFYADTFSEGAVVLRPTYLKNALPGMKLEKALPMRVSLMASNCPKTNTSSLEGKVLYSALVYPVYPTLSVVTDLKGTNVWTGLGIGLASDFSFASLWPNSISLLTNTNLRGEAELLFALDGTLKGRYALTLDSAVTGNLTLGVAFLGYDLSAFGVGLVGGYAL